MPTFARNRPFRHHPRDSNVTHQSTTSSSLYPKSTSTESSLPSPVSLSHHGHDVDAQLIIAYPEDESQVQLNELNEMDHDEVSYRLRLLMQNNYYLPPAHSKPFKDIPSADPSKKSPLKSSSPTALLDLLKGVGKRRNTADQRGFAAASTAPMLRATNDPSTMSGLLRPPNAQTAAAFPTPARPREDAKKGRVVVVREQMYDLEKIARQVEQELKLREVGRRKQAGTDTASQSEKALKDVAVDPTDFVDLPVLPADAQALLGMKGADLSRMPVDAFVNAALLADQLPPSSSGWSDSCDNSRERERHDTDAIWRKAVLLAAVNHSLSNSPANTPARSRSGSCPINAPDMLQRMSPGPLSPLSPSPSVAPALPAVTGTIPEEQATVTEKAETGRSRSRLEIAISKDVTTLPKDRIIGQRILTRMLDEDELCDVPAVPPKGKVPAEHEDGKASPAFQAKRKVGDLDLREIVPLRPNSPAVPTTPLLPPPRHRKTGSGAAQSSESPAEGSYKAATAPAVEIKDDGQLQIQEVEVPGRLSDVYEIHTGTGGSLGETTVAAVSTPRGVAANLSAVKNGSKVFVINTETASSRSHYSDDSDDETHVFHTPREQTVASTFASSRPSLASTCTTSYDSFEAPRSVANSPFGDVFAADLNESVYMESTRSQSVAGTLGDGGRSRSASLVNTLGGGARSRTTSHTSTVYSSEARRAVVSPPPRTSSALASRPDIRRPTSPVRRIVTSPLPPRPSESSMDDFVPGTSYEDPETPKASNSSPTAAAGPLTVPRLTVNAHGGSTLLNPASPIAFFDAVEAQSHEESSDEDEDEDDDVAHEVDTIQAVRAGPSFEGRRSDVSCDLVSLDPRTGSLHSVEYPHLRTHLAPFMQQRNASSPQLAHDPLLSPSDSASVAGSIESGGSISGGKGFWGMRIGGKGKKSEPFGGVSSGGVSLPRASESSMDRVRKETFMHPPIENLRSKKTASADEFGGEGPVGGMGRSSLSKVNVPVAGTNQQLNGLLERHMQREREVLKRIATTHASKSSS